MIVVFEGGDQAGKATQARMLEDALESGGVATAAFAFPDYATPVGRQIEALLRNAGADRGPPQVLHLLLAANRWEALPQIRRALGEGKAVVINRYYHSNIIYGMARGLDRRWLAGLDAGLPEPDLVVLLDIDPAESFKRKASGRDSFESDAGLLERARSLYRAEARRAGRRWSIVDASGSPAGVHGLVLAAAAPAARRAHGIDIA